ncbi:2-keto-4-pentenoate hydratase [Thermoactinomyces mirandus]|uniref:Fumarylacetoacetate hydrolase family protein n=1 Tax=Thermoactinomyces mirandus TaxID=2756294 RepID=A0A7W1XQW6_9BACL|nr:fumarylacetoacetate hydrolase family protein [Thermoactinomyces mirandus]MBA4601390.1 fumarylacetoacetate hydrolase family protein [Thermoactinomyces mirandus]
MEVKERNYLSIANYLERAEQEKVEVKRITLEHPDLSIEEGYKIQEELVKSKLDKGYRIIGPKMGLTSQAKMKQMNVDEPVYGYIFDYMVVENGDKLSLRELIHPKVEVEIAFVLNRDLKGPGITEKDVLAATEYVVPSLEIIDSRYENFQFTLPDVVADNASSSRVVFGNRLVKPDQIDLDLVGATLFINGELKALGAGAAVLGHPARSVAMLANMLGRKGEKAKAGQIILTGGITEAILLNAEDCVTAKLDQIGEVSFILTE